MGGGDTEHEDEWRRRAKPDNELPASVALDVVLAETDDVVISLATVEVYRNGVDLRVDVRTRGDVVAGATNGGFVGDEVLVGVEYADGRRATNLPMWPRPAVPSATEAQLATSGGSGGRRAADLRLYLTPLPPPGTLTIVCAWPQRGIPERVTVIDAEPLREAAGRVRELWPWEPYREQRPPEPPPAPPGGWFEETRHRATSGQPGTHSCGE